MIIANRTFVISGGASGLGRATAQDLHSQNGSVAILDMNEENGKMLVRDLGGMERARSGNAMSRTLRILRTL